MESRKKILFVSLLLPYSFYSGKDILFFNYIKVLSSKNDITLISFVENKNELKYLDKLKPYCSKILVVVKRMRTIKYRYRLIWTALRSLFSISPYHIRKCFSKKMYKNIQELLHNSNYDAIFVVDIGMSQYVKGYNRIPKVLFQPYIESLFYEEYARTTSNILTKSIAILESKKLKRYEQQALSQFNKIITVTPKDADYLKSNVGDSLNCGHIPIGIDTNFFVSRDEAPKIKNILLVGSLFWYPNFDQTRWFLKKIFPKIKGQIPDVALTVVGEGTPRDILKYSNRPGITILGQVEDIRPHFRNAMLMAVPVRICGGGIRTKILVALASKLPVVATSIGCNGLGLVSGENIVVADGEEDFANAVVRVLRDADLRRRIVNNGYSFIKEKFSLQAVSEDLEWMLSNLIEKSKEASI